MRFLCFALLASSGCVQSAPPELECGQALVTASGFAGGAVIVNASIAGDDVVVSVVEAEGRSVTVRFPFDPEHPPLLPLISSPARFIQLEDTCLGEGCGEAYWILRDATGQLTYFEVGRVTNINGGIPVPTNVHLTMQDEPADLLCEGSTESLPTAAVVRSDDGEIVMQPGERRVVTIDGRAWMAMAGVVKQHVYVEQYGEVVADGPGPGVWVTRTAEIVLYLIADESNR